MASTHDALSQTLKPPVESVELVHCFTTRMATSCSCQDRNNFLNPKFDYQVGSPFYVLWN